MDSVVYLLRSPIEVISPYLYAKTDSVTVIAVEHSPLAGRIVESMSTCSMEKGKALSYGELLELLLASRRVITL